MPTFSEMGRGREDDVGELGRLREEDVLHHEKVEVGERLPDLVHVGVGEEGILAHHVHALDVAGERGPHDLDHRQARVRVELHAPRGLEPGPHLGVRDALVIGICDRNQPGVRGPLHVVLPAQRVETRARLPDVPRHHHKCDEAAGVVGAVVALRDAHAPEHHRRLRLAEQAGHAADIVRRYAADLSGRLRIVLLHQGPQGVEVLRARLDELVVYQVFLDQDVHHAVVEGHVRSGANLHEHLGVIGQCRCGAARPR